MELQKPEFDLKKRDFMLLITRAQAMSTKAQLCMNWDMHWVGMVIQPEVLMLCIG